MSALKSIVLMRQSNPMAYNTHVGHSFDALDDDNFCNFGANYIAIVCAHTFLLYTKWHIDLKRKAKAHLVGALATVES